MKKNLEEMQVKVANKRAILESHEGEEFSPITVAKNVLFENGQNLQDVLGDRKEDMMTPTIENSSSMFKVGQGDNVDYSENVVDGAYESCVLKGRSLVNILKTPMQTLSGGNSGWKWTNPRWSLKANTKYFALYFVDSNTLDGTIKDVFRYGDDQTIWGINVVPIGGVGCFKRTFTLPHEVIGYNCYTDTSTTGSANVRCVLLEYQEGMENWDIPYFEGLCDVKSPILTNVGKNLFDSSDPTMKSSWWITPEGGSINVKKEDLPINYSVIIPAKSDSQYKVSGDNITRNLYAFLDKDYNVLHADVMVQNSTKSLSPQGTAYALFYLNHEDIEKVTNLQIEEGSTATPYEPYKSNILSCETYFDETTQSDKTIVLRSLPNGVCDTLNVETGEYMQRIGEGVFNGDENWLLEDFVHDTLIEFKLTSDYRVKSDNSLICDSFAPTLQNNVERIYMFTDGRVYVRILKSKVASVGDFKQYLQSNPLTIQYELATPVVKTVDLSGYPYAYKNGHVQLSSGSIEQSLLPTVEYSVVTNRNGQVRSNQKMVERLQKKLDSLYAMTLVNMIDSQYQQTLANLKYELSKV